MKRWYQRIPVPHVFVLLTLITFLASLMTFIIPAGSYERRTVTVEGKEQTLVVPGTFQQIPRHYSVRGLLIGDDADVQAGYSTPVGLRGFLTAIPRGLEQSADIIFFIFIIGGTFGILQRSGTIPAVIGLLLKHFGHSPKLVTIVVMVVLAIGGSTLGMAEEFIPLVPVFILLSDRLGYDRLYGLSLVFLAAEMGFASATTNPFTVNIAQGVAELPLNSGIGLRIVFFFCCMTLAIRHVLRHGARIQAQAIQSGEPRMSLHSDSIDVSPDGTFQSELDDHTFDRRHLVTILACLSIFVTILLGVQEFDWWMSDMAGGFFLMGIVAAALSRLSVAQATQAFVKGMEDMVVAALVVGFARGIQVVLTDGQILDTLIHSAASVLETVPRHVSAVGMLFFQTSLNFLIPSGSEQAVVTMPIMAPLADVLGITRQTAVLAFQFGDGLSNIVVPTSGVLMAMLALGKVSYGQWLRYILPLFFQVLALAAVFLIIAVSIGYS